MEDAVGTNDHGMEKPRVSLKLQCYLLLLVITLPMDWFAWTGALMREAGARPAIPLMTLASIYIFFTQRRPLAVRIPKETYRVLLVFAVIALCGLAAFVLNLTFSWSYFGGSKDPIFQAAAQMALYLLACFILAAHASLLSRKSIRDKLMSYIPVAAAIHFGGMLLEEFRVLHPTQFPLSIFRISNADAIGDNVNRVAGFFSEPAYFGTMAAIYGLPLLLIPTRGRKNRWFHVILATALFISAFWLGAKTVIPVSACGYVAFLWQTRTPAFTPKRILAISLVGVASLFLITSTAALDVRDNLSTTMRLGTTVTALNVAKAGYGITGLGFGQFHFMYKPEYGPPYLFLSQEAAAQAQTGAEQRASTYNLFVRYLVETGVVGFGCWLYLLARFSRLARAFHNDSMAFGALTMGSALGFLLTQDPYCFPPLILGMAFILASHNDLSKLGHGLESYR
jgi:hypothetical protein